MPPATDDVIGLAAAGAGGGQWTLSIYQGQPVSLHMGLPAGDAPTVTLAAASLVELCEGRATLQAIRGRGGLAIEGDEPGRRLVLDVLGALTTARRGLVTA